MIAIGAPRNMVEKLRDALPQVSSLLEKFDEVSGKLGRRTIGLGGWGSYRFSLKPLTEEVILYVIDKHDNMLSASQVNHYRAEYCQQLDPHLQFQAVPARPKG